MQKELKNGKVVINIFLILCDLNLNFPLDGNINYPLIEYFKFSNVVLGNQKLKEKNSNVVRILTCIRHLQGSVAVLNQCQILSFLAKRFP